MKKLGLTWHVFYRFPVVYLAVLATNALTWNLMPPAGIPRIVSSIVSLLFTVISLYSAARVMVISDKRENMYQGEKTGKEKWQYLWVRPETRLFFTLFCLLPWPLPAFNPIFGTLSPILRYLLSRLFVPFLIAALFLGNITGLHYYERNERMGEKRKKIRRTPFLFFFHVFKYVAIYTVTAFCFLAFTVVLASIPGMIMLFLTTSLGTAVVLVIIAIWIIRAIRGVRKRKRFLEQMEKACALSGIPMPEIKQPCLSLFRKKEKGTIFTFTLRNRKYACKLIGSLKPFTLYRFYPNGTVGHVHTLNTRVLARGRWTSIAILKQQIELWETQYKIGFDAPEDVTKIFLFNPCTKTVEVSHGNENAPLDNGMKVGEYTFYTATGLTNAIARNCLHRKQTD